MSVDETYRILAARYVRKQAKQLARQLNGTRTAEDIESIHQARVASRRLRAALRMFGDYFPAKKLRRWRKQIRRVTAGMGDARDKDVQIDFLHGVLHTLTESVCYPGIARLLVQLERRRERLQPIVVEAVDRLQASGVLAEMRAEGKRILAEAKKGEQAAPSPAALKIAGGHVLAGLDELVSHEDCLADADDKPRHHAMRIAAKRLRYTVEIVGPLYKGEVDDALASVKRLQELLGEIHDCDVWSEHLDSFAKAQRRRIRKLFGHPGPFTRLEVGIEHLRQRRREHREKVFCELAEYWEELRRRGIWEKLAGTIQSRAASCAKPDRPGAPAGSKPATHLPAQTAGQPGVESGASNDAGIRAKLVHTLHVGNLSPGKPHRPIQSVRSEVLKS